MPLAERIIFLSLILVGVVLIGSIFSLTRLPHSTPVEVTLDVSPTVETQPVPINPTITSLGSLPVPTNTSLLPPTDSGFALISTSTSLPTGIPSVTVNTIVPSSTPFVPSNTTIPSNAPFVPTNTRIFPSTSSGTRGTHIPSRPPFVPTDATIPSETPFITANTALPPGVPLVKTDTPIPAQAGSPDQFIRTYFDAIHSRNYEYTWSLLSDAFIATHNGPDKGGYQGYVDYWNSVERVEVLETRVLAQNSQFAEVFVVANYHYTNGTTATGESTFYLTYNAQRNTWLFDVAR